ncbi:type II toxin-antitoxin system VapC family toxin [Candidatus Binatia bacterium]|nr:type II toxin-antitoxin system VapC family toxin [Candidatus Binatia bacterium]
MIVADTDVLVDYLRGRNPMAARVEIELQTRGFATTVVTAFELWTGARTPRQSSAVEMLLAAMTILPLDADGARKGAEARSALLARGEDIGMADCLIAGICLREGAMLITGNRRHFARIDGLKLSFGTEEEQPEEEP